MQCNENFTCLHSSPQKHNIQEEKFILDEHFKRKTFVTFGNMICGIFPTLYYLIFKITFDNTI